MTERYVPPAPRELPELRAGLGRWLAADGPAFYLAYALIGRQRLPAGMPLETGAATIAEHERLRVTAGDLYWVSTEMTHLAQHAAPSLPTWNLYRHDLPSELGLMIFETPLGTYRSDLDRDVQIVAVSWGPWTGPGNWDKGGLWLSFYSHPAPMLPGAAFAATGRDALDWARAAELAPPLLPDNEAGWPFGILGQVPERVEGTTVEWARTLRATWRLMQQPLAEQTRERTLRPARRRLARAGQTASDVRVIHVRRPERAPARTGVDSSGRAYSCQWWVGGHWRTYWCGPGRTRPEDRWISPYLAGPDGQPVRGTERVRVWDR